MRCVSSAPKNLTNSAERENRSMELPVQKDTPLQKATADLALSQLAEGVVNPKFSAPLFKFTAYSSTNPKLHANEMVSTKQILDRLFGSRADELIQAYKEAVQRNRDNG